MPKPRTLAVAFVSGLVSLPGVFHPAARATEWSQYRGPNHNGSTEEVVNLRWAAGGPKLIWKAPTRNGFSSFSVGGGKAYTQVTRDVSGAPREVCLALDANTGKEAWFAEVGNAVYKPGGGDSGTRDNKGGDGPRSTPTYSDGHVYVLSQDLTIFCFDAATGKKVWIKDLMKDHAGRGVTWGSAASPVIDGNLLFVAGGGAGQSLMGIDTKTGQVVWKGQDERITHSTPVVADLLGERQVIFFTQKGLTACAVKDGKLLWHFPFNYSTSTAISPVVCGDVVYCSAGYGVGGGACRISKDGDRFAAAKLWEKAGNDETANHWSTPVYRDGYLYGLFSFKKYGTGPMKCVKADTGEIMWTQPNFGAGQVILVNDKVLALSDDGQLVVVEASPAAYKEVSRAKGVSGKCWSTPVLSNGRIYVRSTTEGVCLDVSGK